MLLRRVARPLLAGIFVSGGLDTLLNPGPKIAQATPLLEKASAAAPIDNPPPPSTLVQVDAAVKVAAGSLLASGYVPRLASAALAASLVPTTLVAHSFWQEQDDERRAAQRIHFFKNLGLLGGLLLASADTHGRPSLGWWARRAARRAAATTSHAADAVSGTAQQVGGAVSGAASRAGGTVSGVAHGVADRVSR